MSIISMEVNLKERANKAHLTLNKIIFVIVNSITFLLSKMTYSGYKRGF